MVESGSINELERCGLPIAFPAAIAAPDGVPEVRSHDVALRTTVRSASLWQKEAIVVSTRSPQVWRLASDEGPVLNGHDFAPAPLSYLAAGLAADYANALGQAAGKLDGIELDLHVYFSVSGSLRRGDAAGSAHNPLLRPRGAAASLGLARILDAVLAASGHGLVSGAKESRFTLTADGHAVAVEGVAALAEPPVDDPGSQPLHPPVDGARFPETVVTKGDDVDQTLDPGLAAAARGGSPPAGPPRLHFQARCTVRPDGIKAIDVLLHHPAGSTFRFLSDEPGVDGISRAPDANTLISAGIGFCFMTQFGRFAKAANRGLGAYHIVQDTRFTVGDQALLVPGGAAPVDTHVFVETGDEDFAREALTVAERSCFLHAMCRSDLRTRVSR